MTPRPRSTDKAVPISIALPGSLARRLDQELAYKQSRSKWIANAIRNKLDSGIMTDPLDEAKLDDLLKWAYLRAEGPVRSMIENARQIEESKTQ
jgi:hypothetical protein